MFLILKTKDNDVIVNPELQIGKVLFQLVPFQEAQKSSPDTSGELLIRY